MARNIGAHLWVLSEKRLVHIWIWASLAVCMVWMLFFSEVGESSKDDESQHLNFLIYRILSTRQSEPLSTLGLSWALSRYVQYVRTAALDQFKENSAIYA